MPSLEKRQFSLWGVEALAGAFWGVEALAGAGHILNHIENHRLRKETVLKPWRSLASLR
jgi:hypothetical protein